MKLNLIYFSAAGTTQKVVQQVARGVEQVLTEVETVHYPLIKRKVVDTVIDSGDVAVFAIPVYAGRVPAIAVSEINKFKSEGASAILVAVYGNREYDDALLELSDIVTANGFVPVAGGAFIAEHSIFTKVAAGRPDENDLALAYNFGVKAGELEVGKGELKVPGKRPYKVPGSIPIKPRTVKRKCVKALKKDKDACGICAALCPVGAIGTPKPSTDASLCIKCGHCIAVCPHEAREWGGIVYRLAERKFVKSFSQPKQAEFFYAE